MYRGKLLLVLAIVGIFITSSLVPPSKALSAGNQTKIKDSSGSTSWGIGISLKIKPYVVDGKCVGCRSIAWMFFKKGHDAKLVTYWRYVKLKYQSELEAGSHSFHDTISLNAWKMETRILWTNSNTGEYVFIEGDFKAKLYIDGNLVKETSWIHLTKNDAVSY